MHRVKIHKDATGIGTAQSSPPILQFICSTIFVEMDMIIPLLFSVLLTTI